MHCHAQFLQCWELTQGCLQAACTFTQLKTMSPAFSYYSKNLFVSGKWCILAPIHRCGHWDSKIHCLTDGLLWTQTQTLLDKETSFGSESMFSDLVQGSIYFLTVSLERRGLIVDSPDLVLQCNMKANWLIICLHPSLCTSEPEHDTAHTW